MATANWLDVNGTWSNAANWSTGAAPTSSDAVQIVSGTQVIDTSLPGATAGVNYTGFLVGPQFAGAIGSDAASLYVGSITAIDFFGERCAEAWIRVDTGDTVTGFNVKATSSNSNALRLDGPGTISTLRVTKGKVRIGSGLTVTNLIIVPSTGQDADVMVIIDSGATVGSVYMAGGVVYNEAALTTLNVSGGTWYHQGESAFNITTLNVWGGTFEFASDGGTVATLNQYGGKVDLDAGTGKARVITTYNQLGGERVITGVGANVTISSDLVYGGWTAK